MTDPPLPDAKYLITLVNSLERDIRDSQKKTELILASLPVGLIILDENGGINVANRIVQDMFGYKRKELFQKSIDFIFPEFKFSHFEGTIEKFGQCANGDKLASQLSMVQVTINDEKTVFLFVADISERYEMERLKRDLIQMISHDLRTPLANVSGVVELLLTGKYGDLSNEGQEQVGKIDKSLNRVINMISELIEIEKLESDSVLIELSTNNLTVTVKEAISDVERLASDKNIELMVWDQNLFAQFDNEKIHRVLVNLISNAIKFSPEDSIIKLGYKNTMDWLEINVTDSGRGIAEEDKELVFSKYHQVQKSDETVKGGYGLGLAICKSIVEAHGGAIGVRDSDLGEDGSTFWFTLPSEED